MLRLRCGLPERLIGSMARPLVARTSPAPAARLDWRKWRRFMVVDSGAETGERVVAIIAHAETGSRTVSPCQGLRRREGAWKPATQAIKISEHPSACPATGGATMLRLSRWCAVALLAFIPLSARAQTVWTPTIVTSAPCVSYYTPATTVSYYTPAPVVSYSVPVTTFYAPPVTTFYAPPVTTYYTPVVPAPVSVSTYRYRLFGRRSVTTVNYGAPVVTYPAPVVYTPRRVAYYTPGYFYP